MSLWDVKIAHTNNPLWWVDRLHRSKWWIEYRSIENSGRPIVVSENCHNKFLWGEWINESHNNKASARYLNVCISIWIIAAWNVACFITTKCTQIKQADRVMWPLIWLFIHLCIHLATSIQNRIGCIIFLKNTTHNSNNKWGSSSQDSHFYKEAFSLWWHLSFGISVSHNVFM